MDYRIIQAPNMKQAMIKIHQELGPNALIYRTRKTIGGIEILASLPASSETTTLHTSSVTDYDSGSRVDNSDVYMQDKLDELNKKIEALTKSVNQPSKFKHLQVIRKKLVSNIGLQFKKLLKTDRKMLGRGYTLAKNKVFNVGKLLSSYGLKGSYQLMASSQQVVNERYIKALIGPSGVGKTTTIIKLAVQFSTKYELDDLGIISTNTDDIYIKSKLLHFCELYNIDHKQVNSLDELNSAIESMSTKRMILIDTHGIAQRDMIAINKQKALFEKANERIDVLLVLSASQQPEVIEDCIKYYKFKRITGSILTKVDEAIQLEPVLATLAKCDTAVSYVCNGEDFDSDIYTLGHQYPAKSDGFEKIINFGMREFTNQSINWI